MFAIKLSNKNSNIFSKVRFIFLRKRIKSYFSNRAQRVQIVDDLSDIANIICGVPQGSVLEPLKFCLYLLTMSANLKYHKMVIMFMLTTLNYVSHSNVNSHLKQFRK